MSRADELVESLSSPTYPTDDSAEPHIVINPDRTITVPDELKRIAVQYDHNIETVIFDCPRYWDNHDMSQMTVYINFMTPDGKVGSAIAGNVEPDASDISMMHFTWTISQDVTQVVGYISFLVCVKSAGEANHWNSELSKDEMYVSEGLEGEPAVVERNPGIITDLLTRMQAVEDLPPTVMAEETDEGYNITLTDINGSETITVKHGGTGPQGPKGDPGGALDQNSGKIFSVFIGSTAEWDAWVDSHDPENVMFFPTDDTTMEDILKDIESIQSALKEHVYSDIYGFFDTINNLEEDSRPFPLGTQICFDHESCPDYWVADNAIDGDNLPEGLMQVEYGDGSPVDNAYCYGEADVNGFYSEYVVAPYRIRAVKTPKGDYALKSDIPKDYLTSSDLDGYAKTKDIPSLEGYALESQIPSLEGYAKTEDIPSLEGYATQSWTQTYVKTRTDTTSIAEGNLPLDKSITLDSSKFKVGEMYAIKFMLAKMGTDTACTGNDNQSWMFTYYHAPNIDESNNTASYHTQYVQVGYENVTRSFVYCKISYISNGDKLMFKPYVRGADGDLEIYMQGSYEIYRLGTVKLP